MKKRLTLICMLLCSLLTGTAFAQSRLVTVNDALAIAMRQFRGQDVDYFLLKDVSPIAWTIFVDAEPTKGWQHNCYVLTIPKAISTPLDEAHPLGKVLHKLPPSGDYVPLNVRNRYVVSYNSKPSVPKDIQTNEGRAVAQHTYAIILSGGVSKVSNYERYWNDCSFIYQTLTNKYGVPKGNIFPIMSDGNNPAEDMLGTTGGFKSQPLDLDNDGAADIRLAATKTNVRTTLSTLANRLQKDDHLFFFVIDHGGSTDNKTNSFINLWGNEVLYDYELADMLDPFTAKLVNVNVALGQCYSGGFNDNLTKVGCVVSSASSGSEPSWACPDIPYDEFVYHWTCAVNEATHAGAPVDADDDGNGRVTAKEAFDYAKAHDRRTSEHPQYVSTPTSVGEDLAFNHLAPSFDLYIKDNADDTGKEPNLTTDEFWKSPSICVRNQDDGIFIHESPVYSPDHQMAYVYVRVYNRGKEEYTGGKFLHLYWAQASTGLTTKAWKGREIYIDPDSNGRYATGGNMEAKHIDTIPAGGYRDIRIRWSLPNLMEDYPEGNFHFCLLAKIMDTPYDDGYVDGKTYFDLRGSNDQAQKNVTIIGKNEILKGFNVYVRNVSSSSKSYTLEVIPRGSTGTSIFSGAKIEMVMSPRIYAAWERGGYKSQNMEIVSGNPASNPTRAVRFVSPQSKIQSISLNGDEFDKVKIRVNFIAVTTSSMTYTFDLVQRDEDGNIIGGETFIVETPGLSPRPIAITSTPAGGGRYVLSVNNPDFDSYEWQNEYGERIAVTESVTLTPKMGDDTYTVKALTEDGEMAVGSISMKSEYGIHSVSAVSGSIDIELQSAAPENAAIYISSVMDGADKIVSGIAEGAKSTSIDASELNPGIYVVSYHINSNIIDQKKVNIQ